jgi:hypothetical protein
MDNQTGKLSAKERALRNLDHAKARLQQIEAREKNKLRKARDRELFQAAGLMIMAGLVDTKTGKLIHGPARTLGGLEALRQALADDGHAVAWEAAGAKLLAAAEKSKRTAGSYVQPPTEGEKVREREAQASASPRNPTGPGPVGQLPDASSQS